MSVGGAMEGSEGQGEYCVGRTRDRKRRRSGRLKGSVKLCVNREDSNKRDGFCTLDRMNHADAMYATLCVNSHVNFTCPWLDSGTLTTERRFVVIPIILRR